MALDSEAFTKVSCMSETVDDVASYRHIDPIF